jgi:hypothetical protein
MTPRARISLPALLRGLVGLEGEYSVGVAREIRRGDCQLHRYAAFAEQNAENSRINWPQKYLGSTPCRLETQMKGSHDHTALRAHHKKEHTAESGHGLHAAHDATTHISKVLEGSAPVCAPAE